MRTSSSRRRAGARVAACLAAGVALVGGRAAPAAAQTLFAWPDTAIDLSGYATIDECYVAVQRVMESAAGREALATGIWRDTIPWTPAEAAAPQPVPVVETARTCLARFAAVDSVPLSRFRTLLPLYLHAGWDDRATALVERRLAAVPAAAEAERTAVLDSVVSVYMGLGGDLAGRAQPHRTRLAVELVTRHVPRMKDRPARLRLYGKVLIPLADDIADTSTTLAQRIGEAMAATADSLTPREREQLEEEGGLPADGGSLVARYTALLNLTLIGRGVVLDSLRRSTAAFLQVQREGWTRATGLRPETFRFGLPLGEHAPPLAADIWLGRGAGEAPRPTRGRISLVAFLTPGDCLPAPRSEELFGGCASALTVLRRLGERFPDLEITVAARTHGHVEYLKDSITPEREAALTMRWLESYGVKAALAVEATDFWRLPAPDGRRIDRATANGTSYTFGKRMNIFNGTAYLVDEDGVIVHVSSLIRLEEAGFGSLIEVLFQRLEAAR